MRLRRLALFAAMLFMMLMFVSCELAAGAEPHALSRIPESEFAPVLPAGTMVTSTEQPVPAPSPSPVATPSPVLRAVGEASWGYGFYGHVVTRYPRGTIVRVCGPLGCTGRVASWGYGPASYTGRIADLHVGVFERVCGPRSIGICKVTLEVWK